MFAARIWKSSAHSSSSPYTALITRRMARKTTNSTPAIAPLVAKAVRKAGVVVPTALSRPLHVSAGL